MCKMCKKKILKAITLALLATAAEAGAEVYGEVEATFSGTRKEIQGTVGFEKTSMKIEVDEKLTLRVAQLSHSFSNFKISLGQGSMADDGIMEAGKRPHSFWKIPDMDGSRGKRLLFECGTSHKIRLAAHDEGASAALVFREIKIGINSQNKKFTGSAKRGMASVNAGYSDLERSLNFALEKNGSSLDVSSYKNITSTEVITAGWSLKKELSPGVSTLLAARAANKKEHSGLMFGMKFKF